MINHLEALLTQIATSPLSAIAMIGSIVLLECLMSVDNAAVLATMVMNLPKNQRNKALRYGIWGAYILRGLSLVFAAYIINIWFIKPIGGLYLMYLAFKFFKDKNKEEGDCAEDDGNNSWNKKFYNKIIGVLGIFWSTVALVEIMDMVFSIDNIFAVVAFSNNIILIIGGVFIGILAMRFVAQGFIKLIEKYKFLETAAFTIIGLLGLKLFISIIVHFVPTLNWLESEKADWVMSALTLLIFIVPIITSKIFNFPKKSEISNEETESN